jgi:phosphoribosylformimino-5-aminoimidazole carboxamide ribotide isomerase
MEIIPAIDIMGGKCVRLTKGNYSDVKIYNDHPLDVAKQFEAAGIKRLHLVDLDGAKAGAVTNWKVLETIALDTTLKIDFGGGIKTDMDVHVVLESGATWATIGSVAVKEEFKFLHWLQKYSSSKFLLAADILDEKIAIEGWQQTTNVGVYDFLEQYISKGVQQVFCTDINRDGMMRGPSIDLYKNIIQKFPSLHFIASGGVASIDDIKQLAAIKCSGVIIGKAIYENKISLKDITNFITN